MTDPRKRALAAAVKQLRMSRRASSPRLPSIRRMAETAGVSRGTMQKTIGILARRGLLSAKPGVGTVAVRPADIVPDAGPPSESHPGLRKWERVRNRLAGDLLGGAHGPGEPLPEMVELCSRYGVGYRTMVKILTSLIEGGALERHDRTVRVPPLPRRSGVGCLALITGTIQSKNPILDSPRAAELFHCLEGECAKINVRITPLIFDSETQMLADLSGKRMNVQNLANAMPLLGTIVQPVLMTSHETTTRLLETLLRLGLPLAALDEVGNMRTLPQPLERNPAFKKFPLGSTENPGREVGRYLLRMGHRRVAYLSPFHNARWSLRRLSGLRRSFQDAGLADAVHPFVDNTYRWAQEHVDGHPHVSEWVRNHISSFVPPSQRSPDGEMALRVMEELQSATVPVLERVSLRYVLNPILEQAIKHPELTAWVAASDATALAASDYLKEHGKSVPHDISIVAFDDTPQASLAKLTSYSFNIAAVARAMIHHLLQPRRGRTKRTQPTNVVTIPGFVNVRSSVTPVTPLPS